MASNAYEAPAGFERLAKLISFSLSGCLSLSETVQVTIDDLNIEDNILMYNITDNDGLYDFDSALGNIEGSVIWVIQLQAVEAIRVIPAWLMSLKAGLLSVLGVRQFRINRE